MSLKSIDGKAHLTQPFEIAQELQQPFFVYLTRLIAELLEMLPNIG